MHNTLPPSSGISETWVGGLPRPHDLPNRSSLPLPFPPATEALVFVLCTVQHAPRCPACDATHPPPHFRLGSRCQCRTNDVIKDPLSPPPRPLPYCRRSLSGTQTRGDRCTYITPGSFPVQFPLILPWSLESSFSVPFLCPLRCCAVLCSHSPTTYEYTYIIHTYMHSSQGRRRRVCLLG